MTHSPPGSPSSGIQRPMSAIMRPPRSHSRMSIGSKQGGGSRASDEDGKTAVKVAVRVRPALQSTDPGYELVPQRFQRPMVHVSSPTNLAIDSPQGRKLFVFDRVFNETVDQEGVWEYLQDSVNSFLQGYNVSILAYGQSGAGKSYTMGTSGPAEQNDPKAMGIVPRAAQMLFEHLTGVNAAHNRTASGSTGLRTPTRYSSIPNFGKPTLDKDWQLKATYVEIYNEQLRDLLLPDTTPPQERNTVTIREDNKGRIILTGLHQLSINSFEDLIGALNFGSAIRQTDATAINAKSSRSHAVFSLNLIRRKDPASTMSAKEKRFSVPIEALSGAETSITVDSKLHFVDLAGSERLKNTGASGERAKEGISINAGLASLGKVISQLSSRQSGAHVSYRDSKLTRLLQDSLGGNAITYMIACVTPPEFHLSETLNTVQYAQRARAIQSKPRIQQISDESDKQAVIDRLKAEVAFLRQQIRNSEGGDRRNTAPQERPERQSEREIELQNHLLDVQESYTALSQRHAKLISELSKASDFNGNIEDLQNVIGDSAMERLKRSHSFAESVEQVVLEYEKTIQSLESSLSQTRSSLANTESSLLERETKCAYVETVNSQLQARMQKMVDREANTEGYLHDLESKLDGHATGEEKNAVIVGELRKELARARENESSCEDYISTLEERLAEADQDMELMQREMNRLEHVIDRQRSLGKLDNLLYELDHIQQNGTGRQEDETTEEIELPKPATVRPPRNSRQQRNQSLDVLMEAVETAIPESDDDLVEPPQLEDVQEEGEIFPHDDEGLAALEKASATQESIDDSDDVDSSLTNGHTPSETPSQDQFVAEKLENVTQELFDLRIQHDNSLQDYDLLNRKYEEALRAISELQDSAVEARHTKPTATISSATTSRPESYLEDPRVHELRNGEHPSSSQSLSSELSSVEAPLSSPIDTDLSERQKADSAQQDVAEKDEAAAIRELENMRSLLSEHQESMDEVTKKYAELQSEHEDSLSLIDTLKLEVHKYKNVVPASPTHKPQVIRRMTSQTITVDRAHRSLASLRNLASEQFENRPEAMQAFEQNISHAMHELHVRMERIQSLEAENKNVKKEMELKATIISGLTRERSSLQGSSPVDMNVVAQMRDQIVHCEHQIQDLQEAHDVKEKQLAKEIKSLNDLLTEHKTAVAQMDSELVSQKEIVVQLETRNDELNEQNRSTSDELHAAQDRLQTILLELAEASDERVQWQNKHQATTESLQESEKQLQATVAELNAALETVEALRKESPSSAGTTVTETAATAAVLESERAKHQEEFDQLKQDIKQQKAAIDTHLSTISALEAVNAESKALLAEQAENRGASEHELEIQKARIAELTEDIEARKSALESGQAALSSLQAKHQDDLRELEAKTKAAVEAQTESRLAEEALKHEKTLDALRGELTKSKDESSRILYTISSLLNTSVTTATLEDQLRDVLSQKQQFVEKYSELIDTNEELLRQLEEKKNNHIALERQVGDLQSSAQLHESKVNELALLVATHEEALNAKEELVRKKDAIINEIKAEKNKSVRLVEELEEQITSSFDQHHNRLSVIQAERNQALEDAKVKISVYEKEIESYRSRTEQLESQVRAASPDGHTVDRTSSMSSNLRKSASAASLPSPPPAIPLPPLPNIAATAASSPPSSRHTSKDITNAHIVVEDQEARIRTMEKHLHAEKQLTATLEEALGDLEAQSNKVKSDMDAWKKKAWQLEEELTTLRSERNSARLSLQAVEEERSARREAEAARAHLEEKMNALSRKKKKSTLNCF
ncbi:hypothetical protein FQN57_002516 [Myotisia sp. PD_48]|nr:hypothetical protein FQN57_002516 [Myotisia sp. PD_48]